MYVRGTGCCSETKGCQTQSSAVSGARRKFLRGFKFRHNRVTSQINLGEVPKARPV